MSARRQRLRHCALNSGEGRTYRYGVDSVFVPSRRIARWAPVIVACAFLAVRTLDGQESRGHSGLNVEATGTDSATVLAFVAALKSAVTRQDRDRVAAMAEFPLSAWDGKRVRTIRDRATFLRYYAQIFTPELRRTIAAVETDSLFSNWQGVMFASGRVWFAPRAGGRIRIIRINAPSAPARSPDHAH